MSENQDQGWFADGITEELLNLLAKIPVTTETDSEAYSLYLQGKHFLNLAAQAETQASEVAFRKALEIDPDYAPAWAGLSRTLRSRGNWGQLDLHTATEDARQAAFMALKLDDTLADAWAMLARIQWVYDWDWYAAEGTASTGSNNRQGFRKIGAAVTLDILTSAKLALVMAKKKVTKVKLVKRLGVNENAMDFTVVPESQLLGHDFIHGNSRIRSLRHTLTMKTDDDALR